MSNGCGARSQPPDLNSSRINCRDELHFSTEWEKSFFLLASALLLRAWIWAIPPLAVCPSIPGAIFACSASCINSQASTAGNSPRAHNFNCTQSPAPGNDLLCFFLLQQLFLTSKKDNKTPQLHLPNRDPECSAFVSVPLSHAGSVATRRGGAARQSQGLAVQSTLPAAKQEHNSYHSTSEQGQGTPREMSPRLGAWGECDPLKLAGTRTSPF